MKDNKYEKPVLEVRLVQLEQAIAGSNDVQANGSFKEEDWTEETVNTGQVIW